MLVVKIIEKSKAMNEKEFRKENITKLWSLKASQHPNISSPLEIFEDSKKFYVVSQYYSCGNLYFFLA